MEKLLHISENCTVIKAHSTGQADIQEHDYNELLDFKYNQITFSICLYINI